MKINFYLHFKDKSSSKNVESEKSAKVDTKTSKKQVSESPLNSSKSKSKPQRQEEEEKSPKLDDSSTKPKKGANKFYAAYMRREGPKNPGSKRVPIGKKDCFQGIKFLLTGVLDSLDREECKSIVEKYGGSVVSGVTKKLDYLIVGEDAGESKLSKAKELNVKQISEDEFLNLICLKSGIKNPTYESNEVEMNEEEEEKMLSESVDLSEEEPKVKKAKTTPIKEQAKTTPIKEENVNKSMKSPVSVKKEAIELPKHIKTPSPAKPKVTSEIKPKQEPIIKQEAKIKDEPKNKVGPDASSQLWVDKYKPTTMAKIIGQGTEKSNANKLFNWLKNWDKFNSSSSDSKAKKWNDQETGSCFKAALLSGPPGIGKTTTAQITSKEAGFTFIEFNASDSRSKKLINAVLGKLKL